MFERLDAALEGSVSWDDVAGSLLRVLSEEEAEAARPFVYAFSYVLLDPDAEEERQAAGGPFGPSIEGGGAQLPPPLASIEPEIVSAWVNYAAETSHPVGLSRLHDLLWERGHGERHVHARAAISAYLTLAKGDWDPIIRVACAARALELGRAINDLASTAAAVSTCLELAEAAISADERMPGVALHALTPLIKLHRGLRPERLLEVVRCGHARYDRDLPWIRQSFTAMLAALVEPGEREGVWRGEVEEWRNLAGSSSGLDRYEHLQHALQLALNRGFTEIADQIRAEIERMSPEEFGLKTMSAAIEIPAKEIDELVDWVAAAGDWRSALRRLGAQGSPTDTSVLMAVWMSFRLCVFALVDVDGRGGGHTASLWLTRRWVWSGRSSTSRLWAAVVGAGKRASRSCRSRSSTSRSSRPVAELTRSNSRRNRFVTQVADGPSRRRAPDGLVARRVSGSSQIANVSSPTMRASSVLLTPQSRRSVLLGSRNCAASVSRSIGTRRRRVRPRSVTNSSTIVT